LDATEKTGFVNSAKALASNFIEAKKALGK
jgi:hypothetical protein